MKKILGVPIRNTGFNWKHIGFNVLEFIFAFLTPAILFLHFVGYLQVSNTPFYIGLIAGVIGLVFQRVFKYIMNKRLNLSFYNKYLNVAYLVVVTLSALALFEVWGL